MKINKSRFLTRIWNIPEKQIVYEGEYTTIHHCDGVKYGAMFSTIAGGLVLLEKAAIKSTIFSDKIIPMQCTGICDKNNRLIYEGDIVQEPKHEKNNSTYFFAPSIIVHEHNAFVRTEINGSVIDNIPTKNLEIIGNIYEDPILLKNNI